MKLHVENQDHETDAMEKELNLKWFDPCSCCPYCCGEECKNCTCEGFYVSNMS